MSCQNIWILPNDNMFYAKAYDLPSIKMENKYNWLIQTREYLLDSWHGGEKKKSDELQGEDYFLFKAS